MIVVLYAILQAAGRIPAESGWRSLRDTADAVDARAMMVHQCGILRFFWGGCLVISLSVLDPQGTLLNGLVGSIVLVKSSDQERPGNIEPFIGCAVRAGALKFGTGIRRSAVVTVKRGRWSQSLGLGVIFPANTPG